MTDDERVEMFGLLERYESEYPDIFMDSVFFYDLCLDGALVVSDETTDRIFLMPKQDTLSRFKDLAERSIRAGRNLFFEELGEPVERDFSEDAFY